MYSPAVFTAAILSSRRSEFAALIAAARPSSRRPRNRLRGCGRPEGPEAACGEGRLGEGGKHALVGDLRPPGRRVP